MRLKARVAMAVGVLFLFWQLVSYYSIEKAVPTLLTPLPIDNYSQTDRSNKIISKNTNSNANEWKKAEVSYQVDLPLDFDPAVFRNANAKYFQNQNIYFPLHPEGPCRFLSQDEGDFETPEGLNHALTAVFKKNNSVPRLYLMSFESFFKHHPNSTLYILGDLDVIDERFEQNGFKVKLIRLNLTDLLGKVSTVLPEFEQRVVKSPRWNHFYRFVQDKVSQFYVMSFPSLVVCCDLSACLS